ncbi:ATPase [Candidatus Pacearchaeota archaeon]|nr:ATPase [Candidatus Pacearchaeota archaeon]|tara:strand:+ start:1246 stop:3531 length:2286 start_codon:yes stop_codon:yes gene_type:complete
MAKEGVSLKIVEALQDDVYKGIARIDPQLMKSLGLNRGDIISISGEKETVAIVDRAYPADVGEKIIRIDALIRKNARTSVGESVVVKKANAKPATKITIAPAQSGIMVQADPEMLKHGLLGRAVVKGDVISLGGVQRRKDLMGEGFPDLFGDLQDLFGQNMNFSGFQQIRFTVVNCAPGQACIINENTEVALNTKAVEMSDEAVPDVAYEDIGGLTEEIKKIREMVELPLKHPEIFDKLGIEPPKGVLLHGSPGTGKTLLAKAVANETDANFILLNGPEVMSKFYGESEKKIRDIFDDADKNAPSIIFIDEIDAVAPKREDVQGEVERRVVSQLLTMMDGLKSRGRVVVIGATNRINSLDPALRRPGRFDREIGISVPDKDARLNILKIHTRNMPIDKSVDLGFLAGKTHGFVGADLSALTKEAAMNVLRKILPELKLEEDEAIPPEVLDKIIVKGIDFEDALKVVRPSAMREVLVETPTVGWEDIGGLDKTKEALKEAVEWPIKNPKGFKRLGIRAPRGILLYGSPGTGKTLLAKAVAKESEANFIQVKGPSLLSMWVGKSEEGVRKVFERARQVAPCIVFFDEIDAMAGKRGVEQGTKVTERVLNQLLAEMDGLEDLKDVTIIGATNRPDMLDTALLRPGRFDRIILVDIPDAKSREAILKVHLKNTPLAEDVKMENLIKQTESFVGADVESLVREAALAALRRDEKVEKVSKKDFDEAFKKIKASVSEETAKTYKKIEEYYLKRAKAGAVEAGPIYTG